MQRDFTFINDIVEGIFRCCFKKPEWHNGDKYFSQNEGSFSSPHKIFNIGNSKPIELLQFIELLEKNIGTKAIKIFTEIQSGT